MNKINFQINNKNILVIKSKLSFRLRNIVPSADRVVCLTNLKNVNNLRIRLQFIILSLELCILTEA